MGNEGFWEGGRGGRGGREIEGGQRKEGFREGGGTRALGVGSILCSCASVFSLHCVYALLMVAGLANSVSPCTYTSLQTINKHSHSLITSSCLLPSQEHSHPTGFYLKCYVLLRHDSSDSRLRSAMEETLHHSNLTTELALATVELFSKHQR